MSLQAVCEQDAVWPAALLYPAAGVKLSSLTLVCPEEKLLILRAQVATKLPANPVLAVVHPEPKSFLIK